jgi:surface polysaccharide O-acyltransferase-like enzyme
MTTLISKPIDKTAWYDNLRVIATIGVIFIHVSSDYVPSSGTISDYVFWIGNIFDSLSRFSVPIFVMLSGALLLPKNEVLGTYLKKRVVRLLFPFLFWSCLYIIYSFAYGDNADLKLSAAETLRIILINLRDGSSLHFWYIYMIFGLYLFVPIIGKWIRNSKPNEIRYFLIIWLFTLVFNLPFVENLKPDVDLSYFSGFLGYLVLGYYLTFIVNKDNNLKINRLAIVLISSGILITVLGTYLVHYFSNQYGSTFYEPLSLNIFLYAAGIFLFFMRKDIRLPIFVRIRDLICRYSYGIFLGHVLILNLLDNFNIRWNFINPVIGIPLTSLLCLMITLTIVGVINKIPFGKYISG